MSLTFEQLSALVKAIGEDVSNVKMEVIYETPHRHVGVTEYELSVRDTGAILQDFDTWTTEPLTIDRARKVTEWIQNLAQKTIGRTLEDDEFLYAQGPSFAKKFEQRPAPASISIT